MITLQNLKDFINAQPDDKIVEMLVGRENAEHGCVLIQYGRAHNLPPGNAMFWNVGTTEVDNEGGAMLLWLADSTVQSETYKDVKKRLQDYEINHQ